MLHDAVCAVAADQRTSSGRAEPTDRCSVQVGRSSLTVERVAKDPDQTPRFRLTRRRALTGSLGAAAAASGFAIAAGTDDQNSGRASGGRIPFHGAHQAGITTPPQRALAFAAFDVQSNQSDELRALLRDWSRTAAALTEGRHAPSSEKNEPPRDTGEAGGLGPSNLTLTFGFGPTIFDSRRALVPEARRPRALRELPPFPNDQLDPQRSGGDLAIQSCADDPQVAFQAIHQLATIGRGRASLRWFQTGFSAASSLDAAQTTPRALIGFKDGTNNLKASDQPALGRHVWVSPNDGPSWLVGGTYLVARRIRVLFDVWDSTTLGGQERAIGRVKASGAPLGSRREFDPVPLRRQASSQPVIPIDAHIRLASADANGGTRILRRGYSFANGIDPDTAGLDAGLFFLSFQRDPAAFIRIQEQLAAGDALSKHLLHVGSALFACPPGAPPHGFVGDRLFV